MAAKKGRQAPFQTGCPRRRQLVLLLREEREGVLERRGAPTRLAEVVGQEGVQLLIAHRLRAGRRSIGNFGRGIAAAPSAVPLCSERLAGWAARPECVVQLGAWGGSARRLGQHELWQRQQGTWRGHAGTALYNPWSWPFFPSATKSSAQS